MKESIDGLVRDACSVVPPVKSEYRRRLQQLVTEARMDELEIVELLLTSFSPTADPYDFMEALSKITEDWYMEC